MNVIEALNQELRRLSKQRKKAEENVISLKRHEEKLERVKNELFETSIKEDRRNRPMSQTQKDKISAALKARSNAKKASANQPLAAPPGPVTHS
jgi:hypothetical protein